MEFQQLGNRILAGRTLASLWPLALPSIERPSSEKSITGGMTTYVIAPYTIEDRDSGSKPKLLRVYDSLQGQKDLFTRENAPAQPVWAFDRCMDLIAHWAQPERDAVGRPGIWLCAEDEPTKAEIEENSKIQLAYIEWLYYKGQELSEQKLHNQISERHRVAGLWLGKEEPWVKKLMVADIAKCPICDVAVNPKAYACPNGHVFRALPKELAELNPSLVLAGSGSRQQASK